MGIPLARGSSQERLLGKRGCSKLRTVRQTVHEVIGSPRIPQWFKGYTSAFELCECMQPPSSLNLTLSLSQTLRFFKKRRLDRRNESISKPLPSTSLSELLSVVERAASSRIFSGILCRAGALSFNGQISPQVDLCLFLGLTWDFSPARLVCP